MTDLSTLTPGPDADRMVDELVLGLDLSANTPERKRLAIVEAIADMKPDGSRLTMTLGGHSFSIKRPDYDNGNADPWPWWSRKQQEDIAPDVKYAAAIESYMNAWRMPASRNWSTDQNHSTELFNWLMAGKGYRASYGIDRDRRGHIVYDRAGGVMAFHKDLPMAHVLAVLGFFLRLDSEVPKRVEPIPAAVPVAVGGTGLKPQPAQQQQKGRRR